MYPYPTSFFLTRNLWVNFTQVLKKGLLPFFTFNWGEYSDFLTFKGGLNPITGSLWLSDVAHHHLSLSVIFIFAGHMYRTNWSIGHSIAELLESHAGPIAPYTPVNSYASDASVSAEEKTSRSARGFSFDPSDPDKIRTGRSVGHSGLYEVLTTSWHAQLAINLAMLGSLSIIVAHHIMQCHLIHILVLITLHKFRSLYTMSGLVDFV
jgi:photosystem I P700 chlorophyll a apoprotein A1